MKYEHDFCFKILLRWNSQSTSLMIIVCFSCALCLNIIPKCGLIISYCKINFLIFQPFTQSWLHWKRVKMLNLFLNSPSWWFKCNLMNLSLLFNYLYNLFSFTCVHFLSFVHLVNFFFWMLVDWLLGLIFCQIVELSNQWSRTTEKWNIFIFPY